MEYLHTYNFGNDGISADCLYRPASGISTENRRETLAYGFVTEENAGLDKSLTIPEINSGFLKNVRCSAKRITFPINTEHGVKTDYDGDGAVPLIFKADVPKEGNYLVKFRIYAEEDAEGLLFLGRRHLAMKHVFRAGETFYGSGTVNVCPIIPRTHTEPMDNRSIDAALIGKGLNLVSIGISEYDGCTVYIAGDSTVTDQSAEYPYDPALSYSGWGQMLSYYLADRAAVSNHAHSGLTTESMRNEGHYAILFDRIKAGDFCLFQFGHNDQKLEHLKAFEGYRDNLIRYIDEIRSKEAVPVIVSPLARNTWKSIGEYNDLLEEYARACEAVAKEKDVPYIDLHASSMGFVTGNGRETARRWYYPSDYTHTDDYGAYLYAGQVCSQLVENEVLPGLEKSCFDEWMPPEELPVIRFPEEEASGDGVNSDTGETERPGDVLTRAEAFEMVIKTAKFFATNVYNDMFDDIVGHETYAGIIQCAWQNGIIPETMIDKIPANATELRDTAAGSGGQGSEHSLIHPERPVKLSEFTEILKRGYLSRRPDVRIIDKLDLCGLSAEDTLTRAQAAYICGQVRV